MFRNVTIFWLVVITINVLQWRTYRRGGGRLGDMFCVLEKGLFVVHWWIMAQFKLAQKSPKLTQNGHIWPYL